MDMSGRVVKIYSSDGKGNTVFSYRGVFIKWGTDVVEVGDTVASHTCAIVERDGGCVDMVYPKNVVFDSPVEMQVKGISNDENDMYVIFGTEVAFRTKVLPKDIVKVARNIWDNPDMYFDYKKGSDGAYYHFLKFLWVRSPDGEETQLAKFVKMNVTTGEGEPPK